MTAREGREERDRILSEVELAHREALNRGMRVLEQRAAGAEPFSANDVREQLRDVGVQAASAGALFNAAIKAGLIRRVGWVASSDTGTHSKPVLTYVLARLAVPPDQRRNDVTVPVRRDRGGRFTGPSERPDGLPLFDFMSESEAS